MTTPGVAGTPLGKSSQQTSHARPTGFSHRVGVLTLRSSDPLAQIETFVTFCGMVWLRGITGEGLRSVGVAPIPQPRACALSCPSLAVYRAGALWGSGLYNAHVVGRAAPPLARPSLCALSALRSSVGGATMTTPGGARTPGKACQQSPRARRTGFYHRVGAFSLLGSGPSLCPARPDALSSLAACSALLAHNTRQRLESRSRPPPPIGAGLCGLARTSPFGDSQKFAVASGSSTQRQTLDNRPCCTPLGSKRPA
jgi:hypothetical protein